VLQDNANVKELVALLGRHACQSMDADYYYGIRAWDRDPHFLERRSPIQRAARMIFLNHTCFNGLYRLNSKGQFNVPYGKWAAPPTVFVEDNLLACHRALQGVELKQESFEACREWARKGDFVYLDPPYVPLSRTSNFTSYTGTPFTQQDQRRLASVFERLDAIGCKVLLSNSDNAAVSELFGTDGRHIKRAVARRNINSKGAARGAIGELIVSNYPV
jgi:DNA adenine methylase